MSDGLNIALKFGGETHRKISRAVWARYRKSRDHMTIYHDTWRRAEDLFRAYLPEKTSDAIRRGKRDAGTPQYTTIEVPQTYAMIMTAHTYMVNVFLSRNPILQFQARHGEPQDRVMALEAIIDYQLQVGEMAPRLFIWLLDMFKYGLGIIGNYWDKETVTVSNIVEVPEMYLGMPIVGKTQKIRQTEQLPGYQGNKIFNIRPYDFVPDWRVPISMLQQGEFCGHTSDISWNELLRGQEEGKYFNLGPLKRIDKVRREAVGDGSSQNNIPGDDELEMDTIDSMDLGYVTLIEMVIDLVPSDWGIGPSKIPEKWKFTLANEQVIIEARPMGSYHNKFPYFVQEYEVNGYELASRGMAEVSKPLNDTLSWLINTHFHSVRKVLNDQLVVDPSKLVMKDVTDPDAGRLIRLKPAAYGQDPKTAIHQLQVVDVTQNHLRDAQLVMEMMQRVLGVSENLMGQVNPGGRKTATEVRTASGFSVNRLRTHAEYASATAWAPLASVFVQNTQQYYDGEQKFKIAGDNMTQEQFAMVTPDAIAGFYDFVPVDGTMPVDKFALANLWKEIMLGIVKIPALMAKYDMAKIFSYTAKLSGAKNIEQFKLQVSPDQQVMQNLQMGNIVPMGGGDGGRRAKPGGNEGGGGGLPVPANAPGVGPLG